MARKKEKTDQELLQIARDIFLEHGPAVSTGEIAKAAEVSQATLFNRFESKRKLMIKALTPQSPTPVILLLEKLPDQRPIPLQLVEIGRLLYQQMRHNEPAIATLRAAGITLGDILREHDDPPPRRGMIAMTQWIEAAQTQGRVRTSMDVPAFVLAFAGSIKNLAMDEHFCMLRADEHTVFHYITHIVDLLWSGAEPL